MITARFLPVLGDGVIYRNSQQQYLPELLVNGYHVMDGEKCTLLLCVVKLALPNPVI